MSELLKYRRVRQPRGAVALSRNDDLFAKLVHAINPGLGVSYDAAYKGALPVDTSTSGVGTHGRTRKFTRSLSQVTQLNTRGAFSGYNSFSGFARVRLEDIAGEEAFMSCRSAGNLGFTFLTTGVAGVSPNRTFKLQLVVQNVAAYESTVVMTGFDNIWFTVGISALSSGTVRFYANGVFLDALAIGALSDPGTQDVTIGAQGPMPGGAFIEGSMASSFVWVNRFLSDSDHARLNRNEWTIFATKPDDNLFVPVSAATGFKAYWAKNKTRIQGAGV